MAAKANANTALVDKARMRKTAEEGLTVRHNRMSVWIKFQILQGERGDCCC